jgi:hypothetical protein
VKLAGTIQSQALFTELRSMRLRSRYMRLFQRILGLRLDLGGMQERMPASCRPAPMIGDWYLRKIEKQPNEVQTI